MTKEGLRPLPRKLTRRSFIIGGLAAVAGGITGRFIGSKFNETQHQPANIVEASQRFIDLHTQVFNTLGEESAIETPPNQYGKKFNVENRQYTLILSKTDENAPNLGGYKRTLVLENGSERAEYTMYDGVIYREHGTALQKDPLDIDRISKLSSMFVSDFKKWQQTKLP